MDTSPGSIGYVIQEFYLWISGVPWAHVGFWFCFVWSLLGLGVLLISMVSSDKSAPYIGFAVFSVPVLLLSLFGHFAFGG